MSSPSTKLAVKVLLSQIALIMDALNDCKSMGLGIIASITETVPSLGSKDTYVEASPDPTKPSHDSLDDAYHKCLECEEETQQREAITLLRFARNITVSGKGLARDKVPEQTCTICRHALKFLKLTYIARMQCMSASVSP